MFAWLKNSHQAKSDEVESSSLTDIPTPRFSSLRTSSANEQTRPSVIDEHVFKQGLDQPINDDGSRPQSGGVSEWGYVGLDRQTQELDSPVSAQRPNLAHAHTSSRSKLLKRRPSEQDDLQCDDQQKKKHARLALVAGSLTLMALGASAYMLVESIMAIVRLGINGKGIYALVEIIAFALSTFSCLLLILWIRTRRDTKLTAIALTLTFLTFAIQIALSVVNGMLVLVWHSQLSARCHWHIDVLFNATAFAQDGCSTSWGAWILAACLRFISVILFGGVWLNSLRLCLKSLRSIVTSSHRPAYERQTSHPDRLPDMQEYDPHVRMPSDPSTTRTQSRQEVRTPGGLLTWLGSKIWGGVSAAFGLPSYESAHRDQPTFDEYDHALRDIEKDEDDYESTDHSHRVLYSDAEHHSRLMPTMPPETYDRTRQRNDASLRIGNPHSFRNTMVEDGLELDYQSAPASTSLQRTGSSGSTQGAIVYVRMSDGRLVRKLSTIESFSEQASIANHPATPARRTSTTAESVLEYDMGPAHAHDHHEHEVEEIDDDRIQEWRETTSQESLNK